MALFAASPAFSSETLALALRLPLASALAAVVEALAVRVAETLTLAFRLASSLAAVLAFALWRRTLPGVAHLRHVSPTQSISTSPGSSSSQSWLQ